MAKSSIKSIQETLIRKSGSYYLCLMQNSTYQIRPTPKARDKVYIAYGPWDYDRCSWWLGAVKRYKERGKKLDISKFEARRFKSNEPEKKEEERRIT